MGLFSGALSLFGGGAKGGGLKSLFKKKDEGQRLGQLSQADTQERVNMWLLGQHTPSEHTYQHPDVQVALQKMGNPEFGGGFNQSKIGNALKGGTIAGIAWYWVVLGAGAIASVFYFMFGRKKRRRRR